MSAAWRANGICRTPGCYDATKPGRDLCGTCQRVDDLARATLDKELAESLAARERASHEEKGRS